MSHPQETNRVLFPFGNPFKMLLPRGPYLSSKLAGRLKIFEANLEQRLKMMKPVHADDVLSLSWMRTTLESLSQTYADVHDLILALELPTPVRDWDLKWVDGYFDNSLELLIILISELLRLNEGQILLRCALRNLNYNTSDQIKVASSSLSSWRPLVRWKNPKLKNCFGILDKLIETLCLPTIRKSAEEEVVMRAMFGAKVQTIYVYSIFVAAFTGLSKPIKSLQVPKRCMWAATFYDLQNFVNGNLEDCILGNISVLKEVEEVGRIARRVNRMLQNGLLCDEDFDNDCFELMKSTEKLSAGLDHLKSGMDHLVQILQSEKKDLEHIQMSRLEPKRSIFPFEEILAEDTNEHVNDNPEAPKSEMLGGGGRMMSMGGELIKSVTTKQKHE